MTCGTRSTYQAGCRCVPCTRANSAYSQRLRLLHARGRLPLRARIQARQTWRLIGHLLQAGYQRQQIAGCLGYRRPILEIHKDLIEQRTALRIGRVYATLMAESPE